MDDVTFWQAIADRFRALRRAGDPSFEIYIHFAADHTPRWRFAGGFDDERFKAAARLAAVKLGAPDGAAAWMSFMDQLSTRSADFQKEPLKATDYLVGVEGLAAHFCQQLADDAEIASLSMPTSGSSPPGLLTASGLSPEQRAANLKRVMSEQQLTKNRLHVLSEVDRQTIQKILDAKTVHPLKLEQLERAIPPFTNNNRQPSQ